MSIIQSNTLESVDTKHVRNFVVFVIEKNWGGGGVVRSEIQRTLQHLQIHTVLPLSHWHDIKMTRGGNRCTSSVVVRQVLSHYETAYVSVTATCNSQVDIVMPPTSPLMLKIPRFLYIFSNHDR